MREDGRGRDAARAWWWAVLRTERDRRHAARGGRPITTPNLRRLLMRRLATVGDEWPTWEYARGHIKSGLGTGKEMELSDLDFQQSFKDLTGNAPLSWQTRLYEKWFAEGNLPSVIDVPTGLGKTMVMAIWLIARAGHQEKIPTRLIYVVDRRTVVDQATDLAERLQCKFGQAKLAISTLRGQLADNREWSRDPSRPAIIIGTVDLIGSALLFSGYRSSYKRRPLEAGLLGQDSLLVLDEAHLSKPFEKLICTINNDGRFQKDRSGNAQGKPVRVIRMSATSGDSIESVPFTLQFDHAGSLTGEDANDKIIAERFEATKMLTLVESEKPVETIAAEADRLAVEKPGSRIVIFVRTPKLVADVRVALKKKNADYAIHIAQLTGTMRGLERDELVDVEKPLGENDHERRVMQRFLKPDNDPSQGNCFLISTSAGEVGFDLNADHLVGDEAPLDSWIQRLGRVNRRGTGNATVILVRENERAKKTDFDNACIATSKLFTNGMDVSPKALTGFKKTLTPEQIDEASSPKPAMVELTDILLDAWSVTSITEPMPGRPEVAPWLRGIDNEQAQTTIAWRAEIELFRDNPAPEKSLQTIFAKHPIRPHESLTVNTGYLLEFLKQIPKLKNHPANLLATRAAIRLSRGRIVCRSLQQLVDDPGLLYAESTLILPSRFGGLDVSGTLGSASIPEISKDGEAEPDSFDVADQPGYEQTDEARSRLRIIIERTEAGWIARCLPGGRDIPDDVLLPPPQEKTKPLFEAFKKANFRVRLRQDVEFDEEGDATRSIVCLAPAPKDKNNEDQLLTEHVGNVEKEAKRIANALHLADDDPIRIALLFAAKWHDEGKKARIWQVFANNPDPDGTPLGKMAQARDPKSLKHYRHEFGSILRIRHQDRFEKIDCTLPSDAITRDLALHLIATHHGGSRPHFPTALYAPFNGDERDALHTESIRRFARLQRKYGWWGLAWLENLLRCADQLASADEEVTEIDELEEGAE